MIWSLLSAGLAFAAPAELRGHGGPVRALASSGSGEIATGSFDTRAIVWDAESGAAKRVLHFHQGSVTAVAFLPNGFVATGGQDGRIALWDDQDRNPERVIDAHSGPITALVPTSDGRALASSAWDRTARVTPLEGGPAVELEGHTDNVNGVALLPDGRLASASYDGTLRLWSRDGGVDRVIEAGAPLNSVVADSHGTIWAAGADGTLRAFGGEGSLKAELRASRAPMISLASDERFVAAGSLDGDVLLVDPGSFSVVRVIKVSDAPVWSLAFDPESGSILAGGADHVVRPWEPATGTALGQTQEVIRDDGRGDSRGARVFRMCAACHTLRPNDGDRAGPTLHGIFGRPTASAKGYVYSEALRAMDIVWTPETVSRLFEIGPSLMVPGTSMPEQRILDPADRAALVDFLQEYSP
jgi:cytochrome c